MATPETEIPEFSDLLRLFTRIGCLSFGGPAGQIALMHGEIVEKRRWVTEEDYLHALNFCHLLPGPEAQQLATWIGWRLHGVKGGLAAGLLFILPGAALMLALSALYAVAADLRWFSAMFLGVKAAVLAIIVQAVLRIGRRALNTRFKLGLTVGAFLCLFLANLPFPLLILAAGMCGAAIAALRPDWLALSSAKPTRSSLRPSLVATLGLTPLWGGIWAAPLALVLVTLGPRHVLWKIGVFFSKLAIVTFGGAYAVLTYMAQEAVGNYGWMRAGEMADGLGLAETTPGPLILVAQHVGFLAAFRAPAPFSPFVAGILGAGLTTWVTFAPCFLWIFAFAPWIDRLQHVTLLKGGLAAVTAAVVGVIGNLSVWFALHVLFVETTDVPFGWLHLILPVWGSLNWRAAVLSALAALLLFGRKWSVLQMLIALAVAGVALGRL